MGSSKKKHKKHKDKDREHHHHHHREKKSRDSSRHASTGDVSVGVQGTAAAAVPVTYVVGNGGAGGGAGGCSTPGSAQPSSSDHSGQLKQVPLRIVLKVPPSCYSPQNVSSSTVQVAPIPTLTISNTQLLPSPQQQQLHSQTVYPEQSAPQPPKPIVVYSTVPPLNATSGQTSLSTPHQEGYPMAQPTTTTTSTSSSLKKAKKSKKSKKSKHRKHSHHHHHSSSSSHRHHRKHHHQSSTCSQHSSAASPSSSSITSTVKYPGTATTPIQGTEWTMQTNPDTTVSATSCQTANQQQPYVATSTLLNYSSDLASTQVKDEEMFDDDSPEHPLPTSTSHNKSNTSMDHSSPTFAHQPESHNNANSHWQSDFGRNGSVASQSVPADQPTHQFVPEIKLKLSKSSNSGQFSSNLSHSPRPPPRSPAAAFTGGHHLQPPISITNALPSLNKLSLPEPGLPTSTFPTSTTGHMPSSLLSPRIVSPVPAPVSAFSTATFNLSTGKSHKSSSKKKNKGEKNLQMLFEHLLKQVTRRDAEKFFAFPVSDAIAPGYSSIIANPMDLSTIKKKMCEYRTLGDFKADVKLMCDNAMKYNRAETIYYKAANKLWLYTKSKLFKKDALLDYAKSYPKCTPLELSLNPSGPPAASKSVTNSTNTSTSAGGLTSFSGIMSSDLINSPFAGSTFSSQKSSLAFEPSSSSATSSVSAFPTGLASSTKPFNLSEPSPNVVFQQQNHHQLVPNPKPISSVMPFAKSKPVVQPEVMKKDICCDGMTAEELIESITASARAAKQKLARERPNVVYSYLQQTSESNKSITMNTIVYNDKNNNNNTNTNTNKELSDCASELSREVISKPFSFESIYKPSSRINLNLFSKIRQQVSNDLDNQNKNNNKVEVKQEMDDHMNSFPNRQQENQKENGHNSVSKFDSKESLASLLAQCDEEELNHHNQKSSSHHHQQQQHHHHHHQQQHSNRMDQQQNRNVDPVKAELIDCYGGEEFGLEYALSISKFARNSEYSMNLVTSLLGVLTSGGHKNVSDKLTTLLDTMPD